MWKLGTFRQTTIKPKMMGRSVCVSQRESDELCMCVCVWPHADDPESLMGRNQRCMMYVANLCVYCVLGKVPGVCVCLSDLPHIIHSIEHLYSFLFLFCFVGATSRDAEGSFLPGLESRTLSGAWARTWVGHVASMCFTRLYHASSLGPSSTPIVGWMQSLQRKEDAGRRTRPGSPRESQEMLQERAGDCRERPPSAKPGPPDPKEGLRPWVTPAHGLIRLQDLEHCPATGLRTGPAPVTYRAARTLPHAQRHLGSSQPLPANQKRRFRPHPSEETNRRDCRACGRAASTPYQSEATLMATPTPLPRRPMENPVELWAGRYPRAPPC